MIACGHAPEREDLFHDPPWPVIPDEVQKRTTPIESALSVAARLMSAFQFGGAVSPGGLSRPLCYRRDSGIVVGSIWRHRRPGQIWRTSGRSKLSIGVGIGTGIKPSHLRGRVEWCWLAGITLHRLWHGSARRVGVDCDGSKAPKGWRYCRTLDAARPAPMSGFVSLFQKQEIRYRYFAPGPGPGHDLHVVLYRTLRVWMNCRCLSTGGVRQLWRWRTQVLPVGGVER